jgi:alkylated DNA repair protein (DNA oxidative demethylase)
MTTEPSDRELGVVLTQLERLGARLVAVGHGRDPRSRQAAQLFVAAWTAGLDPDGDPREVAEVADWPADAASWLRPARRLTETAVDAWVIADQEPAWTRMSGRLRESTDWDPARTVAFAGLDSPATVAAAEPGALDGMVGATADGGLWFIERSTLRRHTPRAADSAPGELIPRPPVEIAAGAVHLPDWLDLERQRRLVEACQGDAPVTPFPDWLGDLARRAVADAYGDEEEAAPYRPDAALINFYDETAKLGMHQDKDERSGAPVVSLSIGDACTFRFGNTAERGAPYTDVELRSGDLFVFGGPSRFAYHGVVNGTQPGTGDPATGLDGGRLNLTLRETGLPDPRDL